MSSSKRSASDGLPRVEQRRDRRSAPDGERIVGGDEAERAAPRPLQPAGQQHAERLVREPALERVGDHVDSGCRAETSRPAARRAAAARECSCCMLQPVAHLLRQPCPALLDRRASRAPARRDRSRAETCRRHRTGIFGRRRRRCARRTHSFSRMPSKRSTLPANRNVSPTASVLEEILLDLAEHAAAASGTARRPRCAATRTLSIGASTIVPTFSRYCWATRRWAMRQSPSAPCADAWRSARRSCSA